MSTTEKLLLALVLGIAAGLFDTGDLRVVFQPRRTAWLLRIVSHNDALGCGPNSSSLASKHYRNRWIVTNQCYTCHVNYEFMGPINAKLDGMRHVVAYYTGIGMPQGAIKLYEPFPNGNCLRRHGAAQNFNQSPTHAAVMQQVRANQLSCAACHQPIHTPQG